MDGNEWTQPPREGLIQNPREGLCRDCAKTFPTMSCYNEGKNFMCPVCSNFLIVGRAVELPTKEDRKSPESSVIRSRIRDSKPPDKAPKLQRGVTMIPTRRPIPQRTNLTKNFQRAKTFAEGTEIKSRDTESGFLSEANTSNVWLKSHFRCREFRGCINSIWPISPSHSWLVIKNSEVALYNSKGSLQHKVAGVHQNITDMAIDSNKNMYLVCFKERLVLKVAMKTEVKIAVFAQMTMTHPTEISTSPCDQIVVAGVGVTSVRYVPGIGREYGVFIYDVYGKMVRKILRTKQEFQYPLYVGVNKHNEIAVGDYLLKRVVLMTSEGQEISTFDGTKTFSRPFIPKGLCYDRTGNVIVANWDGSVCILLREEGYSSVGLRFQKQFSPLSLAVDDNNDLWIGHRQGANVEIYEVDYTRLVERSAGEESGKVDKDDVETGNQGTGVENSPVNLIPHIRKTTFDSSTSTTEEETRSKDRETRIKQKHSGNGT